MILATLVAVALSDPFSGALAIEPTAKAQEQPEDVIRATPLSAFSERAGAWPVVEADASASIGLDDRPQSEIFNTTPGLQARDQGSPTLSIRGSASADRVLRLYEGIPLNLADGLGASRLFVPEEAIGATRVFKGPASVFYGSSAMAGAVDHRTRLFARPALRLGVSDLGGQQCPRSIFAALPFASGQITANHSADPGRYPYSARGRDRVRESNASETSRLTAIGRANAGAISLRPVLLAVKSVGENPGTISSPSPSTYSYTGLLAGLEAQVPLEQGRELALRLSDVRQWGLFDRGTSFESTSFTTRTQASGDLRLPLGTKLISRTFLDTRWDTLGASYLEGQALGQGESEFGEALEIALTSSVSVTAALRFLPGAGVTKALVLQHAGPFDREWIGYSEGFRRPSLSDRFSVTTYFRGNTGLQPERSRSLELGSETGSEALRVSAGVFAVRYDDLFDSLPLSTTVSTKINAGRARADGAEFAIDSRLGDWGLRAAASFLDTRNEDSGEPLRLSPKHQLAFGFSHGSRSWIKEALVTRWSPFFDRNPATGSLVELKPWTTLDLGVRSTGPGDWEIKAGVLNVFDEAREFTLDYPEPQRRVYASLLRSY